LDSFFFVLKSCENKKLLDGLFFKNTIRGQESAKEKSI